MDPWEQFVSDVRASECGKLFGTNVVIGRGSRTPKIVFVGEAPGEEEDRQQKPFVGRSGQMLDEWIAYVGLGADDYYICNVMKTRPPNNRDPTPDEVKLCAPFLTKQLELLQPQIVVAVGRFAMNYFLPKAKGILSTSGKFFGNVYVVPHPSYFLRNGGKGWEPYLDGLRESLRTPRKSNPQTTLV